MFVFLLMFNLCPAIGPEDSKEEEKFAMLTKGSVEKPIISFGHENIQPTTPYKKMKIQGNKLVQVRNYLGLLVDYIEMVCNFTL